MRTRLLRPEDRSAWDRLWAGYLRFYRAPLPAEVTEKTFARLVDGEDDALVGLVAVDDADAPVGLAHLVFHPSTWTAGPYCYLEDLFVAREQRGGDAAQALFDAVYEASRSRGADKVYWHTQAYNGAARSLYDTVGELTSFVMYERRP